MNKTANEIADAVLEKCAVSPGLALKALMSRASKSSKGVLTRLGKLQPRTLHPDGSGRMSLPASKEIKRGLLSELKRSHPKTYERAISARLDLPRQVEHLSMGSGRQNLLTKNLIDNMMGAQGKGRMGREGLSLQELMARGGKSQNRMSEGLGEMLNTVSGGQGLPPTNF